MVDAKVCHIKLTNPLARIKTRFQMILSALRRFALLFSLLAATLSHAVKNDGDSVSTLSAASALNTPLGVRSYGMGMAQTGNANDLSALYYNPAALAGINYVEYALSYHGAPNDVGGHSFLMAIPMPYGTMGLTGVFNRAQDNQYVQNGINVLPDGNKYSYIAGLSYGAPVWVRKINAGLNVKWFGADFPSTLAAPGYARQQRGLFIDLSLLGNFDPAQYSDALRWLPRMSAGFTARNLHPLFRLDNEVGRSDNREEYNAGVSMQFPYKVMFNADAVNSMYNPTRMRYGFEYWPVHFLALRGGITHALGNDQFRSLHWGLGFGETIQSSKLSFEYSAAKEFLDGFGTHFAGASNTYHRFAFHHSFESIEINRGRQTPIRFTERYSHRYRFARELAPREIIADTMTTLPEENVGYETAIAAAEQHAAQNPSATGGPAGAAAGGAAGGETPAGGGGAGAGGTGAQGGGATPVKPKPDQIVGKYIVAVFPVGLEVVAGRAKNPSLKEKLRGNFLVEVNKGGAGRLINSSKLSSAPIQSPGELESAYLKRLQQNLGADLIVFNKLFVDGLTGELKLSTIYYHRGDSQISAQSETVGSDAEEVTFINKATAQFVKDHKAILEELK